jgi:hypothetical protein
MLWQSLTATAKQCGNRAFFFDRACVIYVILRQVPGVNLKADGE